MISYYCQCVCVCVCHVIKAFRKLFVPKCQYWEMRHQHVRRISGKIPRTNNKTAVLVFNFLLHATIHCVLGSPNANVPSRDLVQEGTCSVERNLLRCNKK